MRSWSWSWRSAVAAPFFTLLLAGSALANEPAAVVMAVEGDVHVLRAGGAREPANFGADLDPGDEIRTGELSSADLLFASGQSIHLGAGSHITIQGEKRPAGGGSGGGSNYGSAKRFLQLKESRGTSSVASLRSSGGAAALRATAPCQSAVLGAHPMFRWHAPEDAGELALTVYDDGGERWKTTISDASEAKYPDDAPALEPGVSYSWTLESTDPLQFPPLRAPASFFEIASRETESTVSAALAAVEESDLSESARSLVRASIYYEHGLLAQAIEETQRAMGEGGGHMRAILANLYVEAGRTEDALTVYDGLLEPRR
jgi:hypothetical protein